MTGSTLPAASHSADPFAEGVVFDRAWVLDQIGGDEQLFGDIIEVFTNDAPRLINNVQKAVGTQDIQALFGAAHAARSAVGNFGAHAAVEAATTVELAAKQGEANKAFATSQTLITEINHLVAALLADRMAPGQQA